MRTRRRVWVLGFCVALLCLAQCAAVGATTKKPPLKPVNLNTATSEELQLVPGIGPATAEKILQMRKSYGAFKSVDDVLAIKGIGKKRLDKMRKYLTVGKTAGGHASVQGNGAGPGKASAGKSSAKGDAAEEPSAASEPPLY